MKKPLILCVLLAAISIQSIKAQSENEVVKSSMGGLIAAHVTSAYTTISNTIERHRVSTGAARDTASFHLAFTLSMIKSNMESMDAMGELDFFDQTDKDFMIATSAVYGKLRDLLADYLEMANGEKKENLDDYYKKKAAARSSLFKLLQIEEPVTF